MTANRIIITALGAVLTAVIALFSTDAVGVLASTVPASIQVASTWTWRILGVLVVGHFILSLVRGGRPAAIPQTVQIDIEAAEPSRPGRKPPVPRPPVPHLAHPYLAPGDFLGRAEVRKTLTDWLADPASPPVSALVAVGGMGKSALAWEWVQQDVLGADSGPGPAAPEGPLEGVLWWSFGQPGAGFSVFLDEALTYVSAGTVKLTDYLSSRSEKLQNLLELLDERRFLLVLDAFEQELRGFSSLHGAYQSDAYAGDPRGDHRTCSNPHAAELLRHVLTQPVKSRILLTSRLLPMELSDPATGAAGARCLCQELGGLADTDSLSFMQGQGITGEAAEIQAACRAHESHPLSLRLLAGAIRTAHRNAHIRYARRFKGGEDGESARHHHVAKAAVAALDRTTRPPTFRCTATKSTSPSTCSTGSCSFSSSAGWASSSIA